MLEAVVSRRLAPSRDTRGNGAANTSPPGSARTQMTHPQENDQTLAQTFCAPRATILAAHLSTTTTAAAS